MLKIHLQDGSTLSLDFDGDDASGLAAELRRPEFQDSIRGVTLESTHTPRRLRKQDSVSRPSSFNRVWYEVESLKHNGKDVGERVTVFADDVRLTVTSFRSQPATKIELMKTGNRRGRRG